MSILEVRKEEKEGIKGEREEEEKKTMQKKGNGKKR